MTDVPGERGSGAWAATVGAPESRVPCGDASPGGGPRRWGPCLGAARRGAARPAPIRGDGLSATGVQLAVLALVVRDWFANVMAGIRAATPEEDRVTAGRMAGVVRAVRSFAGR